MLSLQLTNWKGILWEQNNKNAPFKYILEFFLNKKTRTVTHRVDNSPPPLAVTHTHLHWRTPLPGTKSSLSLLPQRAWLEAEARAHGGFEGKRGKETPVPLKHEGRREKRERAEVKKKREVERYTDAVTSLLPELETSVQSGWWRHGGSTWGHSPMLGWFSIFMILTSRKSCWRQQTTVSSHQRHANS